MVDDPDLLARLGFRFVLSRFAYKRQLGEFTQRISINLSHYHTQESMSFSPAPTAAPPA